MTLDQLEKNKPMIVRSLARGSDFDGLTSKLMDMGLYPGKQVTVVLKAPFGDPIAVDVDGYLLSLRKFEASLVEVV